MAVVLGLASQAAMALGLGDIRVLSQPGQPLVAEIPVITADSGELDAARVQLASAATFARVGLAPPDAVVSGLRFDLSQDAHGRAVIRVTSERPVDAAVVSFLVEVDWGQGRLVREYSALVDRPQTAQAATLPQISAPLTAKDSTIVREVAAAPRVAPVSEARAAATPPANTPVASSRKAPVQASAASAPARPAARTPAVDHGKAVTVKRGQTLSHIASGLARREGVSLDQAMVALLESNPHAFVGGNIHRLKAGAALSMPDAAVLAAINREQARATIRGQLPPSAQSPAAKTAAAPPPATVQGKSNAASVAPAGARLEIAPSVAGAAPAKSVASGTVADGEGDQQMKAQLRQANEDLATKEAEIAELRGRLAELETLRDQQQTLIALKDNEMAAAEQQLAQRQTADAPSSSGSGWLWGGGLLLVGAAFVAWLMRRRKRSPLPSAVRQAPVASAFGPSETAPVTRRPVDDFTAVLDAAKVSPDAAAPVIPVEAVEVAAESSPVVPSIDSLPEHQADTPDDVLMPVAAVMDAPLCDAQDQPPIHDLSAVVEGVAAPATPSAEAAVPQGRADDLEMLVPDRNAVLDLFALPLHEREDVAAVMAPVLADTVVNADQAAMADEVPMTLSDVLVAAAPHDALRDRHDEPSDAAGPWGVNLYTAGALEPLPSSRDRLELAIAYLDLDDPDTARTLLLEVAAAEAVDSDSRKQAQELLERLV